MKNIAIITGASTGLGKSFALLLAEGCKNKKHQYDELWLIARNKERLSELAKLIEDKVSTKVIALDISDSKEVIDFTDSINDITVKLLVNCAGMGKRGTLLDNKTEDILNTINLNCTGLTLLTRGIINHMNEESGIINISSSAAFLPQPGFNIYAASKSFVLNLSRALSYELKNRKISVTAVCSGPINTPFLSKATDGKETEFKGIRALCVADPNKLAKASLKANNGGRKMLVYGFMQKLLHVASKIIPADFILWLETDVFKVNG